MAGMYLAFMQWFPPQRMNSLVVQVVELVSPKLPDQLDRKTKPPHQEFIALGGRFGFSHLV